MQRDFSGGKSGGWKGGPKFSGGGGSRGGFGGGRPGGFGGGRPGGFGGGTRGGDREDRQMFPATCGDCGSDCEVPFRPTGSRPVLCRNCFKKDDVGGGDRGGRSFDRPRTSFGFDERPQAPRAPSPSNDGELKAINVKLDKIMATLAAMSGGAEDVFESEV